MTGLPLGPSRVRPSGRTMMNGSAALARCRPWLRVQWATVMQGDGHRKSHWSRLCPLTESLSHGPWRDRKVGEALCG